MDEDREKVFTGWENLDYDILVRIFQTYLSLRELIFGVTHVCRAWRVACCDPVLWSTLDLSHMRSKLNEIPSYPYVYEDSYRPSDDYYLTRTLEISMSLSNRSTRTLIFHFKLFPTDEMLTYTTRRYPNLRRLVLPTWKRMDEKTLCSPISFCRKLESLTMESMENPHFVFASIKENCKKFRELKVMGPIELFFAQNLVSLLPKLKVLSLRCTAIHLDALMKLLDRMKGLEVLNLSHSYIVEQQGSWNKKIWVRYLDETTMNKASTLKQFIHCKNPERCIMCYKTKIDDGKIRWFMYEEGSWKEDEVSSLHL